MRRALLALIVAVIVVAIAWLVASLPGTVTATYGQTTFEAATPVVAAGVLLGFIVLYALFRLIGALWRLPRRLRERRAMRRRQAGDVASTRALVALAAGEPAAARREAARARRLLGDTAQTLLLTAEAGERAGREDEATDAFQTLAARPDAAFLGYRGLLRQAMDRQEWGEAAALAGQAEAAHPGAIWLRAERSRLAIRAGHWSDALALADADAPKAALAAAAAEAEPDPARALKLAKQAWKDDPALAPAALTYARRLRESGSEKRAQAVVRQAWGIAPHPALAAFALDGITDKLVRAQAAQRLARANPENPESRFLLASTALAAGLTGEARRQAEAARAAGLNQRRLWLLLADIEEDEGGETEAGRRAQRDALRHAAAADPDPGWVCSACHTPQAAWHAACPVCGAAGTLRWTSVAEPVPSALVPLAPDRPDAAGENASASEGVTTQP
jgi:HemY protein